MSLTSADLEHRRHLLHDSAAPLGHGLPSPDGASLPVQGLWFVEGESVWIRNLLSFRVARGRFSFMGHEFSPDVKYHDVLVPSWQSSPALICLSTDDSPPPVEAEEVQQFLSKSSGGIVLFRILASPWGKCPISNSILGRDKLRIARPLLLETAKWKLAADSLLNSIVSEIATSALGQPENSLSPAIVVAGPVGSGKSTFGRHLTNLLLSYLPGVCLLDVDLGVPLTGASGCISLKFISQPLLAAAHAYAGPAAPAPDMWPPSQPPLVLASVPVGSTTNESHPTLSALAAATCIRRWAEFCVSVPVAISKKKLISLSMETKSRALRVSRRLVDLGLAKDVAEEVAMSIFFGGSGCIPLIVNTNGWMQGGGWQFTECVGALCWASNLVLMGLEARRQIVQKLNLSNPLGPFIELNGGLLPLPWASWDKLNITHVPSAGVGRSIPSSDVRWLGLAAHFAPSFGSSIVLRSHSEEEFFGGHLIPFGVECPDLYQGPVCIQLPVNRFKFRNCDGSPFGPDEPYIETIRDSMEKLVFVFAMSNGNSQTFTFICYGWMHTMDASSGILTAYVSPRLNPTQLAKANVICPTELRWTTVRHQNSKESPNTWSAILGLPTSSSFLSQPEYVAAGHGARPVNMQAPPPKKT